MLNTAVVDWYWSLGDLC